MEGLANLGISLPTLIAQVINFLVLFVILYLVAYKPVMRMLDERSRKIKESMEKTEYIQEQAAHADQETAKRIAQAGKEGQEIIDQSIKSGEKIRQKAQGEAAREAEILITRARSEILREHDEAIKSLRKEFADLTIKAAEKVIDRSLDKETHRHIIDQVFKEGSGLKKG